MRSVSEYLEKAAEFDRLAEQAEWPALVRRFADVAACYRLLAKERKHLIEQGAIQSDNPSNSD
jgi:hypothetical protein